MFIMGTGNPEADIMLVGDALTSEDLRLGQAFMGRQGEILNPLLREAGIFRTDCYLTTAFNSFPPGGFVESCIHKNRKLRQPDDVWVRGHPCAPVLVEGFKRLFEEIDLVQPKVIVAIGEVAMWAVTGADNVNKWRGSVMEARRLDSSVMPIVAIPVLALGQLYHSPEHKATLVHDLKRALAWSKRTDRRLPGHGWKIVTRPSWDQVENVLLSLDYRMDCGEKLWIDFDLETRAGHIACAGISWSDVDALCIPFMCAENFDGYWSLEEEACVIKLLRDVLTNPNVLVRGQNLLYDCQYTNRWWGWVPRVTQDTMIAHHTCFAALARSLDYQASLYCEDYLYWKDDGKTWAKDVSEDQLWRYNGVDCLRTRQVGEVSIDNLKMLGLEGVDRFQQELFWPVLYAMCRGVKVSKEGKKETIKTLKKQIAEGEGWLADVLGHSLNIGSPKQMAALFYDDLKCQKVLQRKGPRKNVGVTCDDDALATIAKREPLAKPLTDVIQKLRSARTLCSTFAEAELGHDGRMRCSYDICGTETYRFNSRKDAFESGMNLQNVPASMRGMFIPDDGMMMFDMDLDRADLQVVAWEADEPELKAALKKGVDMHLMNAMALADRDVDLDLLIEGTESCARMKHDFAKERKLAKIFCHAVDYGAQSRTLAIQCGITVAQADKCRKLYLGKFPGIERWQKRIEMMLKKDRCVTNVLGYRINFLGDIERSLPEALAWQPQSTVACVINRAWMNIWKNAHHIEVLMQVHDSLVGQFELGRLNECLGQLHELAKVALPYEDELVIPSGVKLSEVSWGEVQ